LVRSSPCAVAAAGIAGDKTRRHPELPARRR
jgi:hypothetical protein